MDLVEVANDPVNPPWEIDFRISICYRTGVLDREHRSTNGEFWADKLMDLANLSIVVLVFGQFVTAEINWLAVAIGFGLYLAVAMIALILRR